ncbi:hypothetical protein ONZ45_g13106 [Pleurotus djamor]|nr:hypothetical protein ONZ45_g13106 [Pleurotus djamor]
MTLSAPARVLSIPEILAEIFELSDKRTNASSLQVNKAWSREVINVEWRHVDSWSRVLGLLAPVELEGRSLGFYRPLVSADHERFSRYASRMRSLTLDGAHFQPSVSEAITRIVSDGKFVSNVQHLSCSFKDSQALQLFVNPKLSSLSLGRMENVWPSLEILQSVFSIVTDRNPPLVSLKLMAEYAYFRQEEEDLSAADPVLASALSSLTQLKSCHLPPDILSPAISEAISTLPNLESLNSLGSSFEDCKSSLFSTHLNQTAFPSLRILSLAISFERAIVSFAAWGRSDTLASLQLSSEVFETPERFKYLSAVVSKAFPHLMALCLTAYAYPSGAVSPIRDVGFEDLEPLLSLNKLRDLSLHCFHPLELCESDVASIITSLKNLTRLHLNPTPKSRRPPRLHITVLNNFRIGPPIKDLGLYIRTSFDLEQRYLRGYGTEESDQMSTLEVLQLGASPLIHRDVVPLVAYLVGILPNKSKISSLSEEETFNDDDTDDDSDPFGDSIL